MSEAFSIYCIYFLVEILPISLLANPDGFLKATSLRI